jgi:hypothetical protein
MLDMVTTLVVLLNTILLVNIIYYECIDLLSKFITIAPTIDNNKISKDKINHKDILV